MMSLILPPNVPSLIDEVDSHSCLRACGILVCLPNTENILVAQRGQEIDHYARRGASREQEYSKPAAVGSDGNARSHPEGKLGHPAGALGAWRQAHARPVYRVHGGETFNDLTGSSPPG